MWLCEDPPELLGLHVLRVARDSLQHLTEGGGGTVCEIVKMRASNCIYRIDIFLISLLLALKNKLLFAGEAMNDRGMGCIRSRRTT